MATHSPKEVMRDAMFEVLKESVAALRKGSVDNAVMREIKAIHGNTSFDDLPASVRYAIHTSVDNAMVKLKGEGYSVTADRKTG